MSAVSDLITHEPLAEGERWRKTAVVDAWQFCGTGPAAWSEAPDWLQNVERVYGAPVAGEVRREGDCLVVYTLEGHLRAQPGDWIIKGVQGEIYPCKKDIFEATYEPALTSPSPEAALTLPAFLNRVRKLHCIDRHHLVEAGAMSKDSPEWPTFRDNPVGWLLRADDDRAAKVWALTEPKGP